MWARIDIFCTFIFIIYTEDIDLTDTREGDDGPEKNISTLF